MASRWFKTKEFLKIVFIGLPALLILLLLRVLGFKLGVEDDGEEY